MKKTMTIQNNGKQIFFYIPLELSEYFEKGDTVLVEFDKETKELSAVKL